MEHLINAMDMDDDAFAALLFSSVEATTPRLTDAQSAQIVENVMAAIDALEDQQAAA